MNEDVMIVNIMKAVVESMTVPNPDASPAANFVINYEPGRSIQILESLSKDDNSITFKGAKYPLFAMLLPVAEKRGLGYYANVTIKRIVFATMVNYDNESVVDRFATGGTYQKILYPLYYEFLKRLAQSPNVIGGDPDDFVHDKIDNPCQQPIGEGLSDYVDTLEILNLELILSQIKNC
jgi:hypothetical protein